MKEGNDISYTVSFKTYKQDLFQNGDFSMYMYFQWDGGYHPHVLSYFDGLPYPRVRWYPNFFSIKMDREGCRIDYLHGLGHFLFWFGDDRKKIGQGGNYPLR